MTEEELSAILDQEVAQSVGYFDGKLADQRRQAMDYYLGEPFGNEVEGRSQFVSRDVADTIEGIMPSLMKIFFSTDEIVKFEPQRPDDEQGAQQATDYTNHVVNSQNPGFVIFYTFFKDALLQKNGFVKVYWDEYQTPKTETYSTLTPEELTQTSLDLQNQGFEIQEIEQSEEGVKFKLVNRGGKICIDPIPPEELRVNKNAKFDLQKERFVCHERSISASELKSVGFDHEDYELERYDGGDFNLERQTRYGFEQEDTLDEEMKGEPEFLLRECYVLIDFDGDGIAERRKVWKSGKTILINEEVDRVPIVTTTPILMPHKLFGLSIADLISDLQLLKSTLIRQLLDNMYLTNSPRMQVLEGMVNIDDLLNVRPGGIVRMKTFDAAKPLPIPFFGAPAFNMLEYVDRIRENRTGQRHFMGVDADALAKDVSGAALDSFKQATMDRIELIARIFAETGVKDLMWAVYELVCKHERKEKVIKLRDTWVKVDPRGWSNKMDMRVTVGLGTGSKAQLLGGLNTLAGLQKGIVELGGMGRIVTEQNVYNLAKESADAVYPKKGHMFFNDPSGMPPPEQKPDPEVMKIEAAKEKAAMQDKTKRDTKMVDLMVKVAEMASGQGQQNADRQAQLEDKQAQERAVSEDRNFQMQMKDREFEHQGSMQNAQFEQEQSMKMVDQFVQQLKESVEAMNQGLQQMVQAQQQQMEVLSQMGKVMSAPKKIITDEKGEPVGVEPVMD